MFLPLLFRWGGVGGEWYSRRADLGMAVYGNLGSLLLKSVYLLVLSSLLGTSLSSEKTASQKVVRLSFYLLNQRGLPFKPTPLWFKR